MPSVHFISSDASEVDATSSFTSAAEADNKSRAIASLRKTRDRLVFNRQAYLCRQKQAVAEEYDNFQRRNTTLAFEALTAYREEYAAWNLPDRVTARERINAFTNDIAIIKGRMERNRRDYRTKLAASCIKNKRFALVLARWANECTGERVSVQQSCVSSGNKRKWCGGVCWCTYLGDHTTHDTPAGRTRGTVEIQCREASKCNPFSSSDENPEQQTIMFVGMILYKQVLSKRCRTAICTQPLPSLPEAYDDDNE